MKNLLSIFVFAVIFLTSCSKESLIVPTTEDIQTFEEETSWTDVEDDSFGDVQAMVVPDMPAASITLQIQVARISEAQTSGEYTVDFSANYDFTDVVLENTQYLDFTDANGDPTTLTFNVNDFEGGVDNLSVTFAMGGNNLSGLTLATMQEIIIDDIVMN